VFSISSKTATGFAPRQKRPVLFSRRRNGIPSNFIPCSSANDGNEPDEEAERMRTRAEELREQVRELEERLSLENRRGLVVPVVEAPEEEEEKGPTLDGKNVLVVGANGRVGSMVCRYLLRNYPKIKEVVGTIHYFNEDSMRGYGRLSYEVGAEDGRGQIGSAWSDERTATFEYDEEVMAGYNLQNLRIVDVELMDPVQCQTITQNIDTVIFAATDFDGNAPRSIRSLDVGLLFRAVMNPGQSKGVVETDGVYNILMGLKESKNNKRRQERLSGDDVSDEGQPVSFVLVTAAETAFGQDFDTPDGTFNDIKRQGELVLQEFPSISSTVLRFSRYDDNFTDEDLELIIQDVDAPKVPGSLDAAELSEKEKNKVKKINRRDAARAAVDVILDESLKGKTVEVWTRKVG